MSRLIIKGGKKLEGVWRLSGNKNEALPLIAASLLFKNGITLKRLPKIGDVEVMMKIARSLGVEITQTGDKYKFKAPKKIKGAIPADLSSKIRGSLIFLSPLLALNGKAVIPLTGGDKIGLRKIDTHLEVFKSFGAVIKNGLISLPINKKDSRRDINIWLSEPSVTATENAIILASSRPGQTIIKNAASEPHVVNFGNALVKAGCRMLGLGTNYISIQGVKNFKEVRHELGEDFMEFGSALVMSAIFGGRIRVSVKDVPDYEKIIDAFTKFKKRVIIKNDLARVFNIPNRAPVGIQEISDGPWPSFPSDLMSVFLVLATQTSGQYLFHEKMFESRLYFTDQLKTLGAQLVLCDPHRVLVTGPTKLHGTHLVSPDIRAGMALVIAALAAHGESAIDNFDQLDRGYEDIVEKLKKIGAAVAKK